MAETWHAAGTAPAGAMDEIERLRGMVRSLAAERDELAGKLAALAAVIPPERFRDMADWFDTDDEFKESMFPGTWPPGTRSHETQDDLRRFADLLSGGEDAAPALPSAAALRAYVKAHGWTEKSSGYAGSIWVLKGTPVAIPRDNSDPWLTEGAIKRVARAEGRTAAEVTAAIIGAGEKPLVRFLPEHTGQAAGEEREGRG